MINLKLENCSIGHQKPLISSISTQLNAGDMVLLIGNNGVGKTTFLQSLLQQIPLLEGKIFVGNEDLSLLSIKDIAQYLAVVFSKTNVPEHLTVQDLISLGKYRFYPYYLSLSLADKEEVQKCIDFLGLSDYCHFPLQKLSDGNLQKAFIGRAILQNSPLILLDEPTTHLDESNKIMILSILKDLAKLQNKIILFSSHDWRLAKEFADKIFYIKNEKMYTGLTEDILFGHQELLVPQSIPHYAPEKLPQINAEYPYKELLISFLFKQKRKDFSGISFTLSEKKWKIEHHNTTHFCQNFEEIAYFLENQ